MLALKSPVLSVTATFEGKRFESDQPTTSDLLFISVRLCGNDIYWACHLRFSLGRKFPFLEIENPIAETQRAEDEMLPSLFGGILAAGRRVALTGARLRGG